MSTLLTSYYDGPDLTGRVRDALHRAGLDPERLRVEDLAALDQFHALGLHATLALAELAELQPGERVLDLGAGIAGPARVLAARFGTRVVAVEPTARFRRLAADLNAATGLEDAIELVDAHGGALPFADGSFDLIWTQAVLPNVADLAPFAAEAHRVLTPGGRWALADTVGGPGGELRYPVPWADGPAESHLLAPEALREALERPGFAAEVWEVGPAALAAAAARATAEPDEPRPLIDVSLLMPDREVRMASLGRNIAEQRIAPVQALLRRAP
jgi:SAM-dependent methyltransferase